MRLPILWSYRPKVRESIFTLEEGIAIISWPEGSLSKESVTDLKDWLAIVQRQIERAGKP